MSNVSCSFSQQSGYEYLNCKYPTGSLVFLLKILPAPPGAGGVAGGVAGGGEQFLSVGELGTVHHVTVAMCGLTLSLNLSCLLVCAIQFLFAAKLVKSTNGRLR